MTRYIVRRTLLAIPTIWGVLTLVFLLMYLIPGDAAHMLLQDVGGASGGRAGAALEEVRHRLGLDRPLYVQYLDYLWKALHADFGRSFFTRQPVLVEIRRQLPWTLQLAAAGTLFSVAFAVPLGVFSAVSRNRASDHLLRVLALLGVSMPQFWLGLLLLWVFGLILGWFPVIGAGDPSDPLSVLRALILPAVALGLGISALVMRMTRSCMLEVIGQDYIRTARAKGLKERVVVFRHALKNALIPVITIVALDIGRLLGGTVVIEVVFSRPGLGKLMLDAIMTKDSPQAQVGVLVYALFFVAINLATDITYAFVDPRVKYS
jgi:ABC-type dipeptide/oligopeptide/nickel transport system permease component